jgi:predicted transcriptional regulator
MTLHSKTAPRPTDGELEILRVLWERGPSTVREVHESLGDSRRTGYTTVLKLLQIMTEKGIVRRDESERAHVYQARAPREETEGVLVGDLLDRAFAGSASALVLRALSAKKTSPQELAQIRRLLDEIEGGKR